MRAPARPRRGLSSLFAVAIVDTCSSQCRDNLSRIVRIAPAAPTRMACFYVRDVVPAAFASRYVKGCDPITDR